MRRFPGATPAPARSRCSNSSAFPSRGAGSTPNPHQLSGGLKQRVMIAMALAMRPKLLVADEPTTALDATIRAQVLAVIRDMAERTGTAVLIITHDFGVVNEVADRVAVMYAGGIIEEGTRAELLRAPRHPYTQGLLRSIPRPEARVTGSKKSKAWCRGPAIGRQAAVSIRAARMCSIVVVLRFRSVAR